MNVGELSPRVAHATHALLASGSPAAGGREGPRAADEICNWDAHWEALSPAHTAAALRRAQELGLAVHVPGHRRSYWIPTGLAHSLRDTLERRFLSDEERAG